MLGDYYGRTANLETRLLEHRHGVRDAVERILKHGDLESLRKSIDDEAERLGREFELLKRPHRSCNRQ